MTSTTGSAITARDFNKDTKDTRRDEWTPGAMHHLIKALGGRQVAIVLDTSTGFSEVNVTLGGVRPTPGYGTFQVLVQRVYSDGKTGGCWYPLAQVGVVMILDRDGEGLGAKYEAQRSYSDEQTAAIRKLQDKMCDELQISDRYNLPRGKWAARSFPGYVHASYTPERILDKPGYTWQSYRSDELASV